MLLLRSLEIQFIICQNEESFFILTLIFNDGIRNEEMILTCPISRCKWQYHSTFNQKQSFRLITMHVETDHTHRTQKQHAQVTRLQRSQQCHKSSLTRTEAEQPLPAQSPTITCPQCTKPFRQFNGCNRRAFEICLNCHRNSKARIQSARICPCQSN